MKKILVKILFFSSCFVLFVSFFNIHAENLSEDKENLAFAILSDVHINEKDKTKSEKLENALSIINKKVPNIDKYIFTGDYTNSGYIEEYKLLNEIYSRNVSSNEKRITIMGNHDYWNGLNIEDSKNRFRNELKEELNSSRKIKGYTFILLSTENDEVHGYYSEKSLDFAKKEIEKSINDNPSKPIFIFTHQPPKDTIYGSDIWGNNHLKEVFNEYKQVILFAGHSHFPLNDERGIYQNNYTVITAGGIGGVDIEENNIDEGSQGLIVKVDKNNKITIIRMDFSNNEEIKKPWIIDNFKKSNL